MFSPSLPADATRATAAEMRAQFNALKALCDDSASGKVSYGDFNTTMGNLQATIASQIAGTSSNSNGVSTLDTPFANDPPTLADIEVLRVKMNELITALRR